MSNETILPEMERDLADVTSYPILTEPISIPSAPSAASPTPPGGAPTGTSVRQLVDGTLREVLGWRPKEGDSKGFLTALNQSFDLKDIEGHTEWKWNQRTYAGQVETDLGAVT